MEEAKAAAYYDELTRKGSGAARFKQGLGFSSAASSEPSASKPPSSSSSFYSNFVRASSPSKAEKQARIESVQNKLKKKPRSRSPPSSPPPDRDHGHGESDRHGSPSSRHRSRSRERGRRGDEMEGLRRRRRSRSRSGSYEEEDMERRGCRSRGGDRGSYRRSRSPLRSPDRSGRDYWREKDGRRSPRQFPRRGSRDHRQEKDVGRCGSSKDKKEAPDYSRLIRGYSQMSSAERVKARMKLQLAQTAEKDMAKGVNTKWERFDFNKEAPLDEDEEIEVAEDDAVLVKEMGQSFRFSAVQAKHEDDIKAAHDEAMFGAPVALSMHQEDSAEENDKTESSRNLNNALISDNLVSAMQQGSWRDRVRRPQDGS